MTLLDVATHLIRRRPTRQRGQWQRFFPPLWVTSTPPIGQCSTARWSFHIPGRPELPPEFPPESLHFISRPVSVPILRSPIPPLRPCAVFFFLADFLIFFFLSFFLIFFFFFWSLWSVAETWKRTIDSGDIFWCFTAPPATGFRCS